MGKFTSSAQPLLGQALMSWVLVILGLNLTTLGAFVAPDAPFATPAVLLGAGTWIVGVLLQLFIGIDALRARR